MQPFENRSARAYRFQSISSEGFTPESFRIARSIGTSTGSRNVAFPVNTRAI